MATIDELLEIIKIQQKTIETLTAKLKETKKNLKKQMPELLNSKSSCIRTAVTAASRHPQMVTKSQRKKSDK